MKKFDLNEKKICARVASPMVAVMLLTINAFAAGTFDSVISPIIGLINQLTGPALGLVGAIGTLYCILLGVKFAKAEEPQEREKAKSHLKNAIIGFLLIFILIVALHFGTKAMTSWVSNQTNVKYNIPTGTN